MTIGDKPSQQDIVNAELFRALEAFGQKLDRAQAESQIVRRKLIDLESAVNTDPETGEMYLPIRIDGLDEKKTGEQKFMYAAATTSVFCALIAVALSLTSVRNDKIFKEELLAQGLPRFEQMVPPGSAWKPVEEYVAPETMDQAAAEPVEIKRPKRTIRIVRVPPKTSAPPKQHFAAVPKPEPVLAPESAPAPAEPTVVAKAEPVKPAPAPTPAPKAEEPHAHPHEHAHATVAKTEPKKTEPKPEPKAEEPVKITKAEPVQERTRPAAPAPVETVEQKELKQAKIEPKKLEPKPEPKKAEPKKEEPKKQEPPKTVAFMEPDTSLPEQYADVETRALNGEAQAEHDMAVLYASGQAVEVDFERAAYWFKKAANNGVPNAHYNLGVMHHQGLGVDKDMSRALDWYKQAAELGHPEAQYNLGIAYVEGVGTDQNIRLGLSYFKKSAAAGVAQAAYNLGLIYESDLLGKTDTEEAIAWYYLAVDGGHPEAGEALTRLAGNDWNEQDLASQLSKIEPAAGGSGRVTVADTEEDEVLNEEGSGAGEFKPDRYLITQVQQILIAMNLLPGPPDGLLSPQTKDAIRAYQRRYSLKVNGEASDDLLEHMVYDRGQK